LLNAVVEFVQKIVYSELFKPLVSIPFDYSI